MAKPLRVAMIAPPWLAMPVKGYGGIELVVQNLVYELGRIGVEVEVFANSYRRLKGVKTHSLYSKELFDCIHEPYYETAPIVQAHMQFALNAIKRDGKFDIIHDHNTLVGPSLLALATRMPDVPPALHTFHGPPFTTDKEAERGAINNRAHLEQLKDMGNLYSVCISEAMAKQAPRSLKSHLLPAVHNAVEVDDFPFVEQKKDYFITLARFTPDKGQHIAIKYALKMKKRLRMAGTVAGIGSPRRLLFELSNPLSQYRNNHEFKYYSDKILPAVLRYPKISYSGNISGQRKMKFLSQAKALLFPIQWEEPFGMVVIEALACGTPVVAMNRGAMPELIEHGKTGFLANNEEEFYEYMQRVDEIKPADCRRSVERKFSAERMAKEYVDRYKQAIKLSKQES